MSVAFQRHKGYNRVSDGWKIDDYQLTQLLQDLRQPIDFWGEATKGILNLGLTNSEVCEILRFDLQPEHYDKTMEAVALPGKYKPDVHVFKLPHKIEDPTTFQERRVIIYIKFYYDDDHNRIVVQKFKENI